MPISVDHHEKRAEVIAVASRLIARSGLEGVSVRDIAEAAGCSTAIVSHYFHSKRELLLLTYNGTIDHATARAMAALAAQGNHPKAYLAEIMPLDEERLMEWRIWIAFWAKAAADEKFADIQRACVQHSRAVICGILEDEKRNGALPADVDCALQARRLLTSVMGMAVQVVYDAQDWPIERQHALIDGELNAIYRNAGPALRIAAERDNDRKAPVAAQ